MVLSNQHLNTFLHHLSAKHNIDLAHELSEFVVDKNPETNKDKIQFVFMAVSDISGVSVGNLLGKDRKTEYTIWKHVARYICIINKYGSLKFIANELGHMDHSTMIASRNKVNDLLDCNDRQMTECFNKIKHLINEPSYFGSDTAIEQMQKWYHENATSPIDYFKVCIQSLTPEQFLEFKKELHEIHDNSENVLTDVIDF